MTKTEILTLLLSSAVISGLVSAVLNYFLELSKNKSSRNFELKREAYMKAITAVSGASQITFNYLLKKYQTEQRINPITVINLVTAHTRKIAPAKLVATKEINQKLDEISASIFECADVLEEVLLDTIKTDSGYSIDGSSKGATSLKEWKNKTKKLEDELIVAMQDDLGLKS